MVKFLAAFVGIILIGISLWEGFETIILPRRVTRRFRLTRLFYRSTWVPWNAAVNLLARPGAREHYISFYGPLSLLLLFGIWVGGLILGFALLHFSTGSTFTTVESIGPVDFWTDLYLSGTTFFTLGLGDVAPRTPLARFLTVAESGMGFGDDITPGCPGRLARHCRRDDPPPCPGPGNGGASPAPSRLGALGRRTAGKSSLLPGPGLLSLPP
jgi:hypothetical protein